MTEKRGLGAYLREIRERQGLTLEEIAEETKINCRFLRAIEEEAWEDLPAEVYVVGYLRAYAEAIGLDPGEVLARYREIHPVGERLIYEERENTSGHGSGDFSKVLLIVILLALLFVLYFIFR